MLRRISTRRLLAVCAATAVLVVGGAAAAVAALTGGTPPPARPLAVAVHRALAAKPVQGVTARITFTNRLLPNVNTSQDGAQSVLAGASGRLWLGDHGRFRLELQSPRGDAQILSDGRTVELYDPSAHTAYRLALPAHGKRHRAHRHAEKVPTVGRIRAALRRLGMRVALAGPAPGVTAGRPSYSERLAPRRHRGLLAGARVAWDAAHGVPLRFDVYAKGQSAPVLGLRATSVSYGPIPGSVFAFHPPAGTKTDTVALPAAGHRHAHRRALSRTAARRALGFAPVAPARLAGRARQDLRLVGRPGKSGALALYGHGLDGVAVFERHARGADRSAQLPTHVSIGGASGHELVTPLGTVLRFDRGGVRYTVIASQPRAAVEAAARGL